MASEMDGGTRQIQQPSQTHHLKRVLKDYQTAAMSSLSGPGTFTSSWNAEKDSPQTIVSSSDEDSDAAGNKRPVPGPANAKNVSDDDDLFVAPPFPIQQTPLFITADQTKSERVNTILEGAVITSFDVGGEKRLCLPQILNTVLSMFSLPEINRNCSILQIFCSTCNEEQLNELKACHILPGNASSCGLITKTDAERLCNALLFSKPPKCLIVDPPQAKAKLSVFHSCFGKCKGTFYPDLYTTPSSLAVECCECHGFLSPKRFVCHVHDSPENRICHWGFDSSNWRYYLLLYKPKAQFEEEELQKRLDEIKSRFHTGECTIPVKKRKQVSESMEFIYDKQTRLPNSTLYCIFIFFLFILTL